MRSDNYYGIRISLINAKYVNRNMCFTMVLVCTYVFKAVLVYEYLKMLKLTAH